ncbi:MAG: hypothetical protein P1U61_03925 [Legionellaceae bacterium]|nr:hypothetical protein [Legionellaceae bacterium]
MQIPQTAHQDINYRVCNNTKTSRILSIPTLTGIELLDIGPSSCRTKFAEGLKPQACCVLTLRVGLRAQAALKRFSANGKNNFPQVGVNLRAPNTDWYFPTASQASTEEALTITEATAIEQPIWCPVLSRIFLCPIH